MVTSSDTYTALILFSIIGMIMVVISIIFIIKKWRECKTVAKNEKKAQKEKVTEPSKKQEKKEHADSDAKEEITIAIEQEGIVEDIEKMIEIPDTFGINKIPCAGCKVILRISTIKRPVMIECPKCGARMKLL
ncbi:MAG: hypothetical protein WC974_06830 [Thermoplasmata archaeon]